MGDFVLIKVFNFMWSSIGAFLTFQLFLDSVSLLSGSHTLEAGVSAGTCRMVLSTWKPQDKGSHPCAYHLTSSIHSRFTPGSLMTTSIPEMTSMYYTNIHCPLLSQTNTEHHPLLRGIKLSSLKLTGELAANSGSGPALFLQSGSEPRRHMIKNRFVWFLLQVAQGLYVEKHH